MSGDDGEERLHGSAASGWAPRATPPALPPDEVHVWRADLDRLRPTLGQLARLLSEDERQRSERFPHAQDRERFTLARGLLRRLLGGYLGAKPHALRFHVGAHGKPALAAPAERLAFNVSHAGERILLAFARGRDVGVDIERIQSPSADDLLAATFFSHEEQAVLSALLADARASAFYRCWTRKEAYLKATGAGLMTPLSAFTVPLTPIPPALLYPLTPHWTLHDLAPVSGYAAALVVARVPDTEARVRCWSYQPTGVSHDS